MAARAGEAAVGIVIEARVWHPAHGELGFRDMWQRRALRHVKRMALFAGFTPEEFFGVRRAFGDPLRRS